jgi:hypothetical protein
MEATQTWFGMLLDDGSRTGVVDTMTELWTGQAPEDLAPVAGRPEVDGGLETDPGQVVDVTASISDPEGDDLRVEWVLRPESGDYMTGGDLRSELPAVDAAIIESRSDGARVQMPDEPGPYRLFVYAWDAAGGAATANVPLLVKGERKTRFPVAVYDDQFEHMPWLPTGLMGNEEYLSVDGSSAGAAAVGEAGIRIRYEGRQGWAGIAWQHPANNWGDQDGGYNLQGATELQLLARGEDGGETVSFGVGLLGRDTAFPDSGQTRIEGIRLQKEWQRFRIPLHDVDLSSIKTGFVVSLEGSRKPVTIYLDHIRFVR